MNLKYLLIAIFLFLNAIVFYITEKNTQSKIDYSKFHHMNKLQINYEVFMTTQADKADIIYETTIGTAGLLDIISNAWKTNDKVVRDNLREELHNLVKQRYEKFKQNGLLQYHFTFPDNTTFLREHKPDKYGDNLTGVRKDVEKVNKTKEIIRGFSQGKTAHALRNIYPLYNKENQYIGTLEISYPSELLQKNLYRISEIDSHFLVNKHIFDSKMWDRDDKILHYKQSLEHKDYLLTLSKRQEKKERTKNINARISQLKPDIEKNFKLGQMFSLVSNYNNEYQVISFYPIVHNTTYETCAWIVSFNDAPVIYPAIEDSYYIRAILFVVFGFLLYFIYKTNQQKNTLARLLTSYDDNVIFSTTDLKGNITHVSKAFCEISGYEKEELIGQPHNIVRHPDMSKEAFKDMWKTIKAGKTWKGHVKNLRKDGSYYWVNAEIEAIYDESNHRIGYSAIRHNITAQKEVEDIQKEIISTMGSIGESRSQETGNHVKRVAEYSKLLALKYGFSEEESELVKQASPMHDIGKVAIPDSILNKPAKLTDEEFTIMKKHSKIGYEMLKNSDRPLLKAAATIALEHHEKYNGTGYPNGISGENIHIYGRITAIADVFDALGSDRVYKKAWEDEKIFQLFREESGKHFDPQLIDVFFENLNEFLEIRDQFKDK